MAACLLCVPGGASGANPTPLTPRNLAVAQPALALQRRFVPVTAGATAGGAAKVSLAATQAKLLKLKVATPGLLVEGLQQAGAVYQVLRVPGAAVTTRVGYPELPVHKSEVQIPYGATASAKNVTSTSKVLDGYDVAPAQESPKDSLEWRPGPFRRDPGVYGADAWYPQEIVTVGPPEVVRGVTLVTVYQFPVQYNAKQRKIRVHDNIDYDLAIAGGASNALAVAAEKRFSPAFQATLAAKVLNFRLPADRFVLAEGALEAAKGSDYLIIAPDELVPALEPLAAHKRAKGLLTKVVKRSTIGAAPTATQIRAFVQNEYLTKLPAPTYLLLVGDVDTIPAFQPSAVANYGTVYVATDNPYGCVDGGDALPDVFVGRLPARTVAEAQQMVTKSLTWEADIAADAAYTAKFLMAAYFQDDDRNNEDDRRYLETIHNISKYLAPKKTEGNTPLTMRRVYVVPGGVSTATAGKKYRGGAPLDPSIAFTTNGTADCVHWLNSPVGFAFHRDHGESGGWSAPSLKTPQVAQLTNGKPFVMYSVNCSSGRYDADCFAEHLMRRNAPAGAAAVVAASRVSPTWINDDMTRGLTDAMFPGLVGSHPTIGHLGPALDHAKRHVANLHGGPGNVDVRCQFELYQIFGDPDLQIVHRRVLHLGHMQELYKPWLPKRLSKASTQQPLAIPPRPTIIR